MKGVWSLLLLAVVPSAVCAQPTSTAVPSGVQVHIMASTAPDTGPAVASLVTAISATAANCNLQMPAPPSTPLVNPTQVFVNDPFHPTMACLAQMPTGLPVGPSYKAVANYVAPSCTNPATGVLVSPCDIGARKAGAPFFSIAAVILPPAAPTGVVVRP